MTPEIADTIETAILKGGPIFVILLLILYGAWKIGNKVLDGYNTLFQKTREDNAKHNQQIVEMTSRFVEESAKKLNLNVEKLIDDNKTAHQKQKDEHEQSDKKLNCIKKTVTIIEAKIGA